MRKIVFYPNPVLNARCREITDDEIKAGTAGEVALGPLVEEMLSLLRNGPSSGVGLAAPQVGVPLRLCIVEVSESQAPPLVLLNPVLSDKKGSESVVEGCLSMPGVAVPVKRPQAIKIRAKDLQGQPIEIDATGALARVVQHEVDHLDGIMVHRRTNLIGNPKANRALRALEEAYGNWEKEKQG